jgi:hypothetical protein
MFGESVVSPRDRIIIGVLQLIEQQYLKSTNDRTKEEYAGLSGHEKRKTLKSFLQKQTFASRRQWAKTLQDMV